MSIYKCTWKKPKGLFIMKQMPVCLFFNSILSCVCVSYCLVCVYLSIHIHVFHITLRLSNTNESFRCSFCLSGRKICGYIWCLPWHKFDNVCVGYVVAVPSWYVGPHLLLVPDATMVCHPWFDDWVWLLLAIRKKKSAYSTYLYT